MLTLPLRHAAILFDAITAAAAMPAAAAAAAMLHDARYFMPCHYC